jgi:hypothetical protein
LEIFDKSGCHGRNIGQYADQSWNVMQPGLLGCSPSAFSGDDLIASRGSRVRTGQNRLKDSLLTD